MLCMCVCVQSCPTLCDSVDCGGSSVLGISQTRILEWVAISFSRDLSQPRYWTHVSYLSCVGRQVLLPLAPPEKIRFGATTATANKHLGARLGRKGGRAQRPHGRGFPGNEVPTAHTLSGTVARVPADTADTGAQGPLCELRALLFSGCSLTTNIESWNFGVLTSGPVIFLWPKVPRELCSVLYWKGAAVRFQAWEETGLWRTIKNSSTLTATTSKLCPYTFKLSVGKAFAARHGCRQGTFHHVTSLIPDSVR